jgi:hypothetical protein
VITDERVLRPLSSNRTSSPLSFRHALERLAVSSFDATIGDVDLRGIALAESPFRLIAVVNRTDLSVMPDRAGAGGEGRLVFALTDGPADDDRSAPLPFTVIFEYAQHGEAADWAKRWHALGSSKAIEADLVVLTKTFVDTGSLAQIRTADGRSASSGLVFRQFEVNPINRHLVARNVRNSPDWAHVTEETLRSFVETNEAAIEDGTFVLPKEWWASSATSPFTTPSYVSSLKNHDALIRGTCGGCHDRSNRNAFHIDPRATGKDRLSTFLATTETQRRKEWMQITLAKLDH